MFHPWWVALGQLPLVSALVLVHMVDMTGIVFKCFRRARWDHTDRSSSTSDDEAHLGDGLILQWSEVWFKTRGSKVDAPDTEKLILPT